MVTCRTEIGALRRSRPPGAKKGPRTQSGTVVDAVSDLRESHFSGHLPTLPDGVEADEAAGHGYRAGGLVAMTVVSVPAAQSPYDPGKARQGSSGVRIFQFGGLALELGGEGFDQRFGGLVHGVAEFLARRAGARVNQLQRAQCGDQRGEDEFGHDLRGFDLALLQIEALALPPCSIVQRARYQETIRKASSRLATACVVNRIHRIGSTPSGGSTSSTPTPRGFSW